MKKIFTFLKKKKITTITILLSIIIISTIFILQKVSPFGKHSLLTIDFFHQYGPMLAELYDRLNTHESLIYSFNSGLGLPFFRNFFNYLSSPFNILMLLFKRKDLLTSFSIIIGIKTVFSSIAMSFYLSKKFKTKKLYIIGLSLLYTYSAYFIAYYWNIMWIDGLIYLPLITFGIENIINKNNGIVYTISLTLMLFTNYFIGYMLCIYSVIYFIAYSIIKYKNIKDLTKKTIKFAICSLISGLLCAWQLIPMFEALTSTNATTGTMPTSQYYSFTFLEFFKNLLTGVNSTVFASDISNCPNVSTGILPFSLTILFILNKKIKLKKKIVYLSFLLLLLISFYFGPIDYIWHAFHVPNDLPYRYSFIFSFITIIISTYTIKNIKNESIIKIIITYIITLAYITIIYLTKYNNINTNMILTNYILITLYLLILLLFKYFKKYKKIAEIIFLIVISIECILKTNNNWDITQKIEDFYEDYKDISQNINFIKNNDKEKFYRIEKTNILTFNDGTWYDYYGQSVFSSMAYNDLAILNNKLGQPGNEINSYYYKTNTPIYDLMFNIKYTIGTNNDNTYYKEIFNENGYKTYEFLNNIGLMYGTNNIKKWKLKDENPFINQNDFIKKATNISDVLEKNEINNIEIISENDNETIIKYTYNINNNNTYIYSINDSINYLIIDDTIYYKNDTDLENINLDIEINNYKEYSEKYIINKNTENQKNIDIYISYKNYYYDDIFVYSLNNKKFYDAYSILNKYKVNITNFKEDIIEGTINNNEFKNVYTSIPYDKGWKVYINNKKVQTYKINDTFLGFDIPIGNNKIKLKYVPNNFYLSLSLSGITLSISTIYLILKKKKVNHQ